MRVPHQAYGSRQRNGRDNLRLESVGVNQIWAIRSQPPTQRKRVPRERGDAGCCAECESDCLPRAGTPPQIRITKTSESLREGHYFNLGVESSRVRDKRPVIRNDQQEMPLRVTLAKHLKRFQQACFRAAEFSRLADEADARIVARNHGARISESSIGGKASIRAAVMGYYSASSTSIRAASDAKIQPLPSVKIWVEVQCRQL